MPNAHPLDRLIGTEMPRFASPHDIAAFEAQAPWPERVAAASTYEALRLGAQVDPEAPALQYLPQVDPDEAPQVTSHAALFRRLTQAANAFHALGVVPGQVVSFLLPLVPQAFVTLYGAQAAGISNPVNPMLSPGQIGEILRAAGTRVLVVAGPAVDAEIWAKVQALRGELPSVQRVLVVGGAAGADTAADDFDALLDAQPADALVSGRTIRADDIAGCFHTGGTTGTPKLVRHTHANQVSQAWGLRLTGLVRPGGAMLFGLPLFHVGGSLTQGLAVLANGGSLVVLGPAGWRDARAVRHVWRLVERFRPPVFGAVPTVLGAALQVPRDGVDISCLELASGGGAAIPVAVIQAYEAMGLPVLEVYGMTETSSVHCMGWPGLPRQAGSVGRPLPYSRVRVVRLDAEGRCTGDCATDEIGVVAMAGPGAFAGYVSDSHNRTAFVEPGWVNSGDLGRIDASGELWITGRAKDLIIRGGHNIDPAPIEALLYRHPAVALAAVVGQPDTYAGELPVGYVQCKPGASATMDELLDYLREHTPERAAVPVALHPVDPMPLTAVGKIFKPALREDAMRRVALRLLEGAGGGAVLAVRVQSHPAHGQVLRVDLPVLPAEAAAALEAEVHRRLDPLALRHEVRRG